MSKHPTFILPTIENVTDCILSHWNSIHAEASDFSETDDGEGQTGLEFRVWATSSERYAYPSSWGFEIGDSGYDPVHGDICADGYIDAADVPDEREARKMARGIVSDLRAQRAEFQSIARDR